LAKEKMRSYKKEMKVRIARTDIRVKCRMSTKDEKRQKKEQADRVLIL
jgi:hypothetical protein